MAIRVFEYGYLKAEEDRPDNVWVYQFPNPLVIYFEKNHTIKDELELIFLFPNEQQFTYKVPVLKYWEMSKAEILKRKMYPLLPLQLFSLRADMEKAAKKEDFILLKELSIKAIQLAKELLEDSKKLNDNEEILFKDYDKLLVGIQNLTQYLNRKYIKDKTLETEVIKMTLTVINPEVERNAQKNTKIDVVLKSIAKGLDNEIISDITGLSITEIESLRNEMKK
jgi:hypothetical protein